MDRARFGVPTRIAQDGITDWAGDDLFAVLYLATVLGIPVGLIYREIFLGSPKKR